MIRALFDINVVLDVLLDRKPHVAGSLAVWAAVETGGAEGLLAAHAVTTIYYLYSKAEGAAKARRRIADLLSVFGVAAVGQAVIKNALESRGPDFEDSVTAAAAQAAGCDLIITRDPGGFHAAPVRTVSPSEAAPLLAS